MGLLLPCEGVRVFVLSFGNRYKRGILIIWLIGLLDFQFLRGNCLVQVFRVVVNQPFADWVEFVDDLVRISIACRSGVLRV